MSSVDSNGRRRGVIENLLITPSAVVSIVIAVVGQMLVTIWWARGESARISRVEEQVAVLKYDIDNYRTPLSGRVLKAEQLIETGRETTLTMKVDHRALEQRLQATLNDVTKRFEANEAKINDHLTANLRDKSAQEASVIGLRESLRRLDDQVLRIIQALDATYNLLNDHLRIDHSSAGHSRTTNPPLRLPRDRPPIEPVPPPP